jgi:putative inorganic carbon (hco3(-)) transporter
LSDVLAGAGVLAAASASAASILLPPNRARSAAMALAIVLFPILILGDQWHTAQIVDLRHDTGRIVALVGIAAAAIGVLAYAFRRWPALIPLAIVFALPFRIPLHAGGDTANLLVPLYLVIAGAVVATAWRDWTAPSAGGVVGVPAATGPAGRTALWLPRVLAAVVALYALQTLYSDDFSKGLQNVCFFLVPFTVAYGLLRDVSWDRKLLTWVLIVVGIEAAVFVLIGSVEYVTRSLFWNDQVIRSNEFHTYFRVNSVFWDPNVYGRYLALVITVATAALLWAKDRRNFALLTILVGVLWFGLAQTFSQSSFIALLAGLAMLAALRWSWRWTLAAVAVGAVGAVLVVLLVGGSDKIRLNIDTSGRANLVSGGVDLFEERPLWGYGSGAFQRAYRDHSDNPDLPVSISHTEPVTVAAEQGLLGLALYLALIVLALWTMSSGLFASRAGGIGRGGVEDGPARSAPPLPMTGPARQAVLAAFIALLAHTMAYAGFFEDPITWVLLAVGASLAAAEVRSSA